ncbi:MAG: ribbon-helix-helix domain-containing protein [Candidatus Bathyarchaeia archaeon]
MVKIVLSITVSPELYEKLKKLKSKTGISISKLIEKAVIGFYRK